MLLRLVLLLADVSLEYLSKILDGSNNITC